jgi:hypothetical protein
MQVLVSHSTVTTQEPPRLVTAAQERGGAVDQLALDCLNSRQEDRLLPLVETVVLGRHERTAGFGLGCPGCPSAVASSARKRGGRQEASRNFLTR